MPECLDIYRTVDLNEPCREKSCLWGFRPGLTQTGLYGVRSGLKFRIWAVEGFTIMICAFVFASPKSRFSHDMAQLLVFIRGA